MMLFSQTSSFPISSLIFIAGPVVFPKSLTPLSPIGSRTRVPFSEPGFFGGSSSSERNQPMCDSMFTFGQRGSHFLQCPSRREYTRLPKKLARFLTSTQVRQIYHVTLGFEDSFLLTWRDSNGKDRVDASGLPAELLEFLHARNRDIPHVRCSLGPYNASFFVHDKASYLWKNLPDKLLAALQSNIKDGSWLQRPRLVALGAASNFLLVTENNAAVWDLRHYKAVVPLLERTKTSEVHSLALHSYRFQSFVLQARDGKLLYENIPPHQLPGVQQMVGSILQDTNDARKKHLARRESEDTIAPQRRPTVLQQRAQLRREWSEHSQEFTAQAKGVKLSLSLSIGIGGLARMLG